MNRPPGLALAGLLLAALACSFGGAAPDPAATQTAIAAQVTTTFGVHVSGQQVARPEVVALVADLGANWARINVPLGESSQDVTVFLDAGINLVLTFSNEDTANADTTYGTPREWPNAGFPFVSKEIYQQQVRDALAPLAPHLSSGRQVWAQAENEVGDASLAPSGRYWRGTTDQYLAQLQAFYEAVKSVDPSIPVVLSGFASEALEAARDPSHPHYEYASGRISRLLAEGQYDAVDLHFYGCVEDIPAKIAWVQERLPAGRTWISTENGGPDSRCETTPVSWQADPTQFEQLQAAQVPIRLAACAENGGSVCLWFALFDLQQENDVFGRLGLLDQSEAPPRRKPAYEAFRNFLAAGPLAPITPSPVAAGNPFGGEAFGEFIEEHY